LGGFSPPFPIFGRTVNPISTKGSILCPSQYYEPPGFSDLATALSTLLYSNNAKSVVSVCMSNYI
jgi:hypothetical protein